MKINVAHTKRTENVRERSRAEEVISGSFGSKRRWCAKVKSIRGSGNSPLEASVEALQILTFVSNYNLSPSAYPPPLLPSWPKLLFPEHGSSDRNIISRSNFLHPSLPTLTQDKSTFEPVATWPSRVRTSKLMEFCRSLAWCSIVQVSSRSSRFIRRRSYRNVFPGNTVDGNV